MHPSDIPQFSDAYFYKYRPWNEFSKETLVNNSIWFSSPLEVNDPFDCRFPDIKEPSHEQLKKYHQIQYINLRDPLRDKSRVHGGIFLLDAYIEASINNNGEPGWEQIISEAKNVIFNKSSFCSLSEVNNSPLMFAHYADSHKGICLEFRHTLEYSLAHVEAVEYQKRFASLDIFEDWDCDDESLVQATMYRKSVDWSYEREWRAFRLRKNKGLVEFDPRCLSGIVLGCKMPESHREEAIQIAKNRENPVSIYESIMGDDGVSFDVRAIDEQFA
jgi:hypothetical protein